MSIYTTHKIMNSGAVFDCSLKDKSLTKVSVFDMAHHGHQMVRFTGGTNHHYSVLKHSINCAILMNYIASANDLHRGNQDKHDMFVKAALLHDLPTEIITGDIATPMKNTLPLFREYEDRLWQECFNDQFGFETAPHDISEVKEVDKFMFHIEWCTIMGVPRALKDQEAQKEVDYYGAVLHKEAAKYGVMKPLHSEEGDKDLFFRMCHDLGVK